MKLRHPPARAHPDFNLPMINLVFLLLLFFMLAGTVEALDVTEVTPPSSISGERQDNGLATILMDGEGNLFLGDQPVELASLGSGIAERLEGEPDLQVRFKVDGAASTIGVIQVLDRLRDAGVAELVLLTLEANP